MRIDKVYIKKFKNLEEFSIDIDENQWENVFLGQNATGKSNFFEALVLIFKNLDINIKGTPPFEYNIFYTCKGKRLNIFVKDGKYHFTNWGKFSKGKWASLIEISRTEFERRKEEFLPNHIFIYYSGNSERMQGLYIEHQRDYYLEIIKPEAKGKTVNKLRRIFLVQNIHSKLAFLSFILSNYEKEKTLQFLKNELGITDFYSLQLVLRKPVWSKISSNKEMFWNSGGLVRTFLDQLWEVALAPIYNTENVPVSYKSSQTQERLYLFIPNKEKLEELVNGNKYNRMELFNAFESIHISDLLEDVKLRVKKVTTDTKIPFAEMSEGEQQLLTVLGMLRFLKDKESLILLDEPDTHLNPLWKWKYLDYFRDYVGRDDTTQILINTHDPLVIGGLERKQIRVFRSKQVDGITKVTAEEPDIDPRGLGVAGILTSELFGLPTTLDLPTQELLNRRNELVAKQFKEKLSEKEQQELKSIFDKLNTDKGISFTYKDPIYQMFIQLIGDLKDFKITEKTTIEDRKKQDEIALKILSKLKKEEKL